MGAISSLADTTTTAAVVVDSLTEKFDDESSSINSSNGSHDDDDNGLYEDDVDDRLCRLWIISGEGDEEDIIRLESVAIIMNTLLSKSPFGRRRLMLAMGQLLWKEDIFNG